MERLYSQAKSYQPQSCRTGSVHGKALQSYVRTSIYTNNISIHAGTICMWFLRYNSF